MVIKSPISTERFYPNSARPHPERLEIVVFCKISSEGHIFDCSGIDKNVSRKTILRYAIRIAETIVVGQKLRDGSSSCGAVVRIPITVE